jgi:hypothetical protein
VKAEATLSDTRPVNFRRLEDEAPSSAVARPAWLNVGLGQIRPAAFTLDNEQDGESAGQGPSQGPAQEPAPREPTIATAEPSVPVRRSSLPPRKSLFPPQVLISRVPPPPVELVELAKPSPEQEAFVLAALDLAALRARMLSSVESELLMLSVHIAQVIIEREVTLDPGLHCNLARTAVLALGDTQAARLRVSRSAYRAISELYGEAVIDVDGVRVEVSMDASLDALSVIAEGGPSRVDARMDERLSAVLRAMQAEHRRLNAAEAES